MAFEIESRHLGDVVVLAGKAYEDAWGYFLETTGRISFAN